MSLTSTMQTEIDKLTYIYETTYKGRAVDLYISQSDDVIPARARIVEGYLNLGEWEMGPQYRGLVQVGNRDSEAPLVSVFASLPRVPTPAEYESHGRPGVMVSKKARLLFKASPLALEFAKYKLEQKHKQERDTAHHWGKIPCSKTYTRPATSPKKTGRPSILIGFHWLEHGGAEKLALDTVKWAFEAGLRVFVISELDGLHRIQDKLPNHPDIVFLRTDRYLSQDNLTRFVDHLIQRENIKAIHIHHHTPLYGTLPSVRARHQDVTVIDSTHIIEHFDGGFVRIAGVWSNFVDHHHVISHELSSLFLDKFQVREKVVLGRLLDHERTAKETLPFSLELDQSSLNIAFVGRMTHQKRPALVALQMKALSAWGQEHGVTMKFNIVGEGPYLQPFKALLARYSLNGITTLHEANADVPAILAGADILLLPSSNEGLALVCYEAIEQGAIPISTNVGAQKELVPDALLLDSNPRTIAKQTVEIVSSLIKDANALSHAKNNLLAHYNAIREEPTAYDILTPLYTSFAKSS